MNTYLALFLLFSALSFIGFLWLAIVAFKRGIVWGLAVLLLSPITAIVFSLINWFEARKAFLLYITTFVLSFGTLIFIYSQVGLGNMQQITMKMHRGELTPQQAYQLLGRALEGDHGNLFAVSATKQQLASRMEAKTGQVATPPATDKSSKQAEATHTKTQAHSADPAPSSAAKTAPAAKPAPADKTSASTDKPVARAKPTKVASATKAADPPAASQPVQDPVEDDPPVPNINKVQKDPLAQHNTPPSDKVTVRLSRISHYIGRSFLITLKNGTTHRGILRKVSRTRLELDLQLYGGNFVYRVSKDQIRKIQMYKRVRMD